MENSEDVLKIDKNLVTTKRGSCDQLLAKIKFYIPSEAFMFQVPDVSRDVNNRKMIRN